MKSSENIFYRANLIKLGMYLDVVRRDLSIVTSFESIRGMVQKIWSDLGPNLGVWIGVHQRARNLVVGNDSAPETHPRPQNLDHDQVITFEVGGVTKCKFDRIIPLFLPYLTIPNMTHGEGVRP